MEEGVGRFIIDTCLQKDDYGGWKGYDAGTNAQLEQQARSPQFAPLPPAHEQSRRCSRDVRIYFHTGGAAVHRGVAARGPGGRAWLAGRLWQHVAGEHDVDRQKTTGPGGPRAPLWDTPVYP